MDVEDERGTDSSWLFGPDRRGPRSRFQWGIATWTFGEEVKIQEE